MPRVIILGGGMAGLAAAHELLVRGYVVELHEKNGVLGGKARSTTPPPSTPGGRPGLPNEHGFRFFPGFYAHIDDTMGRIPTSTGSNTMVSSHLVATGEITLARQNVQPYLLPDTMPAPGDFHGFLSALMALFMDPALGVPADEELFFLKRLICFLGSGNLRRTLQYDLIPWTTFIDTAAMSPAYTEILANGLTRSLVAMQPQLGSSLTVATILIQILLDILDFTKRADRVLDGPTSEVWIDPWVDYLNAIGGARLTICLNSEVSGFQFNGSRVQSVTVIENGSLKQVGTSTDHFICALPIDIMQTLLATDPDGLKTTAGLTSIDKLHTRWMNGVLFYLNKEVQSPPGHVIYLQAPWAITSIEQQQFWQHSGRDIATTYGDGTTKQILSTIISEWYVPGQFVTKEASQVSSPNEIFEEVWQQLKVHRAAWGAGMLADSDLNACWLDPAISGFSSAQLTNAEPLLVNEIGSYACKPNAVTGVPNFFVASDYVQTYTDLATMEAANEAGRRAVIGVLNVDDPLKTIARPAIFPLQEPGFFEPLKAMDDLVFALYENDPMSAPEPAICKVIAPLSQEVLTSSLSEKWLLPKVTIAAALAAAETY